MYYQSYEDYIRSILGYPAQMQNTYSNDLNMQYEYITETPRYSGELLDLYPEIYKIVNPMVCKICESNTKPITRELIDQMTEEIYLNLESEPSINEMDTVNVRVNLPEEQKENKMTNTKITTRNKEEIRRNRENKVESTPTIREYRQTRRNSTLQDLIKILILNQLLGGNFRPPRPPRPRPPFPDGPIPNPRPPFPGGPGSNPRPPFPDGPNPRPPMRPRDIMEEIM